MDTTSAHIEGPHGGAGTIGRLQLGGVCLAGGVCSNPRFGLHVLLALQARPGQDGARANPLQVVQS